MKTLSLLACLLFLGGPVIASAATPQALRERAGLQFALFVHGTEAALLIA